MSGNTNGIENETSLLTDSSISEKVKNEQEVESETSLIDVTTTTTSNEQVNQEDNNSSSLISNSNNGIDISPSIQATEELESMSEENNKQDIKIEAEEESHEENHEMEETESSNISLNSTDPTDPVTKFETNNDLLSNVESIIPVHMEEHNPTNNPEFNPPFVPPPFIPPPHWQPIPTHVPIQPVSNPPTKPEVKDIDNIDRLRTKLNQSPWDIDSWTALVNEVLNRKDLDPSIGREIFEMLVKQYPTMVM